jgi:O-antigen/teichoic acid export membrane protein
MEDTGSIKSSVLKAVGWATATRLVGQMANWAMTFATVRLLRPEDYGLMAMTMAIAGFVQSLSYVGVSDAIVQKRHISDDDLRSVFGLILLINAACLALLCGLAYPAAWFYGEPRLVVLLQFASLMFIPIALQSLPRATLEKKLDLKTVSRIELVSNVAGGAFVLALAWAGAGVWALISGMLFTTLLRSLGFGLVVPYFRRPRFTLRNLSGILRFGGLRTAEQLLWALYTNSDVFIIGKLLGSDILGIYSVSYYVAALPVDKLAIVIKPVAFPAFAQVQHDRAEALRYLEKALRLLAYICFPIFFGIAATSPQIVAIALGPKWAEAVTPLAIVAFGMTLRPVGLVIPSFLMGIGEVGASFKNTLFATILFPLAFVIGGQWGLVGACAAWLVAYPLQFLALIRRVALVSKTSIAPLIEPLLSPLAGSLVMYIAVRASAAVLPEGLNAWNSFACLATIGILVYLGYTAVFLRPVLTELSGLVRR